ncbi:hypothetical protein OF83DRAFT_1060187, partial [Amylostereum chailletii]
IYDRTGQLCAFGLSQPQGDPTWNETITSGSDALTTAGSACTYHSDQLEHRRGDHPSLSTGMSCGNGNPVRILFIRISGNNDRMSRRSLVLIDSQVVIESLRWIAPLLHQHIGEFVDDTIAHDPSLKKPFSNSVYPACTFNCGTNVATFIHKDNMNIPYGLCAITALGNYDHRKGGHLYLRDLKVLVEFPPGSTLFVPSAVMAHGNTPVMPGETRQSFTQYCAGGLVRWRDFGFTMEKAARNGGALKLEA